jgi:hypothetical protein
MSLSPPYLRPLVLISSLATFGFAGTGTAHHPDEQDLQFKVILIPTFNVNMNDRSWIGAV